MALIFGVSTDLGSSRHTSRIIGPFLRWVYPAISDEAVSRVQFCVRKGAHLTEYAILAAWIWRALRRTEQVAGRASARWSHRQAALAVLLAGLFAATDEWHQTKVPSREGQFSDVLIDTTGAAAGMLALWWLGKRLGRW